jgi:biopolymer transport protein TolR
MALGTTSRRGLSKKGRRSRRLMGEINVTPFVDVMLVLLIIFMVAAPLLTVGVPVDLPKTEAKSLPTEEEPLSVTILANGQVYLQDEMIAYDQLMPRLTALAGEGYDRRIFIRAAEKAPYGIVMQVMARINTAGYKNIGLVTDTVEQ